MRDGRIFSFQILDQRFSVRLQCWSESHDHLLSFCLNLLERFCSLWNKYSCLNIPQSLSCKFYISIKWIASWELWGSELWGSGLELGLHYGWIWWSHSLGDHDLPWIWHSIWQGEANKHQVSYLDTITTEHSHKGIIWKQLMNKKVIEKETTVCLFKYEIDAFLETWVSWVDSIPRIQVREDWFLP